LHEKDHTAQNRLAHKVSFSEKTFVSSGVVTTSRVQLLNYLVLEAIVQVKLCVPLMRATVSLKCLCCLENE